MLCNDLGAARDLLVGARRVLVVVAQLAERQVVVLEVGGSSPLGHPRSGADVQRRLRTYCAVGDRRGRAVVASGLI